MDITRTIADLKKEPGFADNVGMILVHNGVVRGWSRDDGKNVSAVEVAVNEEKVESLRREYEGRPGIYKILIDFRSGTLRPGDDLLFILVAGDIRENVKPILSELLDRVKAEAVRKTEIGQ